MSAHFAMLVSVPSAVSAGQDGEVPLREGLAARVAAGPGLWEDEDWLAERRRDGLIGELLAGGVIGHAGPDRPGVLAGPRPAGRTAGAAGLRA